MRRGYLCDPEKNTECSKSHCWLNGGLCKITTNWDYATNSEQKKYPKEEEDDH